MLAWLVIKHEEVNREKFTYWSILLALLIYWSFGWLNNDNDKAEWMEHFVIKNKTKQPFILLNRLQLLEQNRKPS